jgi:hypothetical protein
VLSALLACPAIPEEVREKLRRDYPRPSGKGGKDIGELTVKYYHGSAASEKSRVYADKGYQGLKSEARSALGRRFYHDIDMENAQPRLILKHAVDRGWKCECLARYIADREPTLARVMAFYGVERKAAKLLVNRIMFGGGLAKWEVINECELKGMPEMVAFHREFKGIRESVWDAFRKGDFPEKESRHDKLSANMSAWAGAEV